MSRRKEGGKKGKPEKCRKLLWPQKTSHLERQLGSKEMQIWSQVLI